MSPTPSYYMMCLVLLLVEANKQGWSEQTYLDVEHTLTCKDTSVNFTVSSDITGVWTKLGYLGDLAEDDHYELTHRNLSLVIKRVTQEMGGIYFCDIVTADGQSLGRVVRGLNIVDHLYQDLFDKYGTDIIRGVITAASVMVLVVAVCLVDRFQYRNGEQRQTEEERTENRKQGRQQRGSELDGGSYNKALDHASESGAYRGYGSLRVDEIATSV